MLGRLGGDGGHGGSGNRDGRDCHCLTVVAARRRNLVGGIIVLRTQRLDGKATGDKKLEGEGKADKVSGKIRNAVGGMKDALRGK